MTGRASGPPPPAVAAALAEAGRRRVLMTTEATYPHVVGGVSSWCDLLVNSIPDIEWQILPIVGAKRRPAAFELPPNAHLAGVIELWSEGLPWWRPPRRDRGPHTALPAILARSLIGWEADHGELVESLVWCRRRPDRIRRVFHDGAAWDGFLAALDDVTGERPAGTAPAPVIDVLEAATLYQTLYWVARTAAAPTPATDVLHVTAAGWAALPALVHQSLHGTPMILTEHGVYVREAYLAATRSTASAGSRFCSTRLARGLAMAAYAAADVIAPVTDANARWEEGLGVEPDRIQVIYNGVKPPEEPVAPPGERIIVSVARIDPLKDVHTMLRVAVETLRHVPDAQFVHYGPVTPGQEAYGRSCFALHEQLGLGDRFRFMGRTRDPDGAVRDADIALLTSISEALPISILEAMRQARPVVSTGVGGVPDVLRGCGVVAPPRDVHGLALGLVTLLRNPALATSLGRRGYDRVRRIFSESACVDGYRGLLLAGEAA